MIWILILIIVLLTVFWLIWRNKNKRLLEMSAKFPGPMCLPLLGNFLLFICKPEEQMMRIRDLITEYGDTVRFWLGPDLNFVISNPDDIKYLLTNSKTSFKGPQYKYMAEIIGGGILSGSGPTWRLHRKLAAPNYGKQVVESYTDVFNSEMDNLLEKFRKIPRGQVFNVYDNVVQATTYSVCQALMGLTKEQTMQLPHLQNVIEKNARMTKWYMQIDPVFWISDSYREQKSTVKILKEFSQAIIKHRKYTMTISIGKRDIDFMEPKINPGTNAELGIIDRFLISGVMDEDTLWQETFTIFTSSQEAGAKIASFLLLMMAYHPECQEKLYAEIIKVIGEKKDRWVNGEDLKLMPYLDMVFKEVIRLFPTGAMIQRSIQEDIHISSGTLPAGSSLIFPIYHLQRNPRFWTNPEAFDPERFSPENSALRNPNCFIPFSLGPMDCIGRYFGTKLVKTVCVRILREYKLTSLKTYKDLKLYIAIAAKSLNGYDVKINLRK